MNGRTVLALAAAVLGIVACVDVPDNMRAQFAPAGPNDRTNYKPGTHGAAMPAPYEPLLPRPDAGAPAVTPEVAAPVDAGTVQSALDGGVA